MYPVVQQNQSPFLLCLVPYLPCTCFPLVWNAMTLLVLWLRYPSVLIAGITPLNLSICVLVSSFPSSGVMI